MNPINKILTRPWRLKNDYKSEGGFTLIELITVMVIVAIVSSFSISFVVTAMKSFVSVSSKASLLSESRLSMNYMLRRLRNALPYSVRITNNNSCLEFMPIVASGLYFNLLPSIVNGAKGIGSTTPITTSPFSVIGARADYLAIAANSSAELYSLFPGSLAAIHSTTGNTITLAGDKQWLRNSINQRFYIIERPSAFCIVNDELRLYRHIPIADANVDILSHYDLLSDSVLILTKAFSISSAVEDRNMCITLSFLFTNSGGRLESIEHVVVRNVP